MDLVRAKRKEYDATKVKTPNDNLMASVTIEGPIASIGSSSNKHHSKSHKKDKQQHQQQQVQDAMVSDELKVIGKKSIGGRSSTAPMHLQHEIEKEKESQSSTDMIKDKKSSSGGGGGGRDDATGKVSNEQRLAAYAKRQQSRKTLLQTQLSSIGCTTMSDKVEDCQNIRTRDIFACAVNPNAKNQMNLIKGAGFGAGFGAGSLKKHNNTSHSKTKTQKTIKADDSDDDSEEDDDDDEEGSSEEEEDEDESGEDDDDDDSEEEEEDSDDSEEEEEEDDVKAKGNNQVRGNALAAQSQSNSNNWGGLLACVQPQGLGTGGNEEEEESEEEKPAPKPTKSKVSAKKLKKPGKGFRSNARISQRDFLSFTC
eukprot:gene4820-9613_t